jgi:hypothetical protein
MLQVAAMEPTVTVLEGYLIDYQMTSPLSNSPSKYLTEVAGQGKFIEYHLYPMMSVTDTFKVLEKK